MAQPQAPTTSNVAAQNSTDWIASAFESAKTDFMKDLKHPERYDFTKLSSAEAVYQEAVAIETRQAKSKTLSALVRIDPYIKGLEGYVGVIDTFAQAKADLLSLIWGPLKLILQMASSLTSAFRKVVEVLEEIGRLLPQFETYTTIFHENKTIHNGLFLFYRDILNLHGTLLNFFANKRWNVFLESLWPNLRGEIDDIKARIAEDASLITSNASLEHIKATEKLRQRTLEEFRKSQRFRDDGQFLTLSQALESKLCKEKLGDAVSGLKDRDVLGSWLLNDPQVSRWLAAAAQETFRRIWLQGIPGAGKTCLIANLVRRMQSQSQAVIYAFFDHSNQGIAKPLKFWQSMIFQMISHNRELCPVVHECFIKKYDALTTNAEYVEKLFGDLAVSSGAVHIVIDGIDEVEESTRVAFLESLHRVAESRDNLYLLLSSRPERDIEIKIQGSNFHALRADKHNSVDIENYVRNEGDVWTAELQDHGADPKSCQQIRTALGAVAKRANGMFLYAKLVLNMGKSHAKLKNILAELEKLPNGLNDAYGRILSRLRSLPGGREEDAKRVLMWVASATYPLSESEILQALSVEHGSQDFPDLQRQAWLDTRRACGPIIENANGVVQFVHFTAKEFFFGSQGGLFLSLPIAEVELALTCLTYLTFRSFDSICSEDLSLPGYRKLLRQQIIDGDFLLFQYAANSWLHHIRCCSAMLENRELNESDARNHLKVNLSNLFSARQRSHLSIQAPVADLLQFAGLAASADHQLWLGRSHDFVTKLQSGQTAHDNDPVMVCAALMRFRRELDLMFCPASEHAAECVCPKLKRLYGERTFRCDLVACQFYLRGFDTLLEREQHMTLHRKQFKCPEMDCLFADLGFSTNADLSRHVGATHAQRAEVESSITSSELSRLPQNDIYQVLQDSVRDDQLELAKTLLAMIRHEPGFPTRLRRLFFLASAKASGDMLTFILDAAPTDASPALDLEQGLAVAIDRQNFYTAKVLLERGADVNKEASFPDSEGPNFLNEDKSQQPRRVTWSRWLMVPINRAFGLLDTAIIHLLVDRHNANVNLFTGFGFVNCRGIFSNYTDDDRELANQLSHIAASSLFHERKHFEDGFSCALTHEYMSILEFCLANGADVLSMLERPGQTALSRFLTTFLSHGQGMKKRGKMLKVILRNCVTQGLGDDIRRLGDKKPDLVRGAELYFDTTWKDIVDGAQGSD